MNSKFASLYIIAYVSKEPVIKIDVVHVYQIRAQCFFCFEKMTDIGAAEILARVAFALAI